MSEIIFGSSSVALMIHVLSSSPYASNMSCATVELCIVNQLFFFAPDFALHIFSMNFCSKPSAPAPKYSRSTVSIL